MSILKCPKSKSLSQCLTELFPIYQNKHWTIRQWDNCSIDPSSHRIILKIDFTTFCTRSNKCQFTGLNLTFEHVHKKLYANNIFWMSTIHFEHIQYVFMLAIFLYVLADKLDISAMKYVFFRSKKSVTYKGQKLLAHQG